MLKEVSLLTTCFSRTTLFLTFPPQPPRLGWRAWGPRKKKRELWERRCLWARRGRGGGKPREDAREWSVEWVQATILRLCSDPLDCGPLLFNIVLRLPWPWFRRFAPDIAPVSDGAGFLRSWHLQLEGGHDHEAKWSTSSISGSLRSESPNHKNLLYFLVKSHVRIAPHCDWTCLHTAAPRPSNRWLCAIRNSDCESRSHQVARFGALNLGKNPRATGPKSRKSQLQTRGSIKVQKRAQQESKIRMGAGRPSCRRPSCARWRQEKNNMHMFSDILYQNTDGTKLRNSHIFSQPYRAGSPTTGSSALWTLWVKLNPFLGAKTHVKKHRIVVYVFSPPQGMTPPPPQKKNLDTRPVLGQSRKFVYVYVFGFLLLTLSDLFLTLFAPTGPEGAGIFLVAAFCGILGPKGKNGPVAHKGFLNTKLALSPFVCPWDLLAFVFPGILLALIICSFFFFFFFFFF